MRRYETDYGDVIGIENGEFWADVDSDCGMTRTRHDLEQLRSAIDAVLNTSAEEIGDEL